LFDEHQHTHVHGDGHHHDHDHGHGHVHADELTEAPLDPASQSLSDALRASFWLLKLVMIVILGCFAFSGMFIVDANEVAIVSHFGSPSKTPLRPGFHPAWPYPIDEVIRVTTSTRTLKVEDFWLVIRNEDRAKPLDQLVQRGAGLDPAVDGALLTADRAIMHASFRVEYRVPESEALNYVTNVKNDEELLRAVIKEAAVAEAARTTADVVWRDPKALAAAVRTRAQAELTDKLKAGIQIDNLTVPETHYPLQTASEFLAVNTAENRKRELINEAQSERHKKLNGIAGRAWEAINREIEKLDQVKTEEERRAIIARIDEILAADATGEAGGKIKLAQRDREKIVNDTLAEVSQFEAVVKEYQRNPGLVRLQLGQAMRQLIFSSKGVAKWVLPTDDKQLVFWLNKDPKEIAEQEAERMKNATKGK
jgi:regulator of protease activity HflC (stomatin/prohibitin superfamily)